MTPDAMEFIRRFLLPVLPTGFMKVRYYGFLNPNAAVNLDVVRCAFELCNGFEITTPEFEIAPVEPLYCPSYDGELNYLRSVLSHEMPPVRDTG